MTFLLSPSFFLRGAKRWRFLLRMARLHLFKQDRSCPYCGSRVTKFLGSKYLFLWLLRCDACCLMFRYPKDSFDVSQGYYQQDYSDVFQAEINVNIPDTEQLERLRATNFTSVNDLSKKILVLRSLTASGKVLDYGCSWGYGVWQLAQAGYEATGFEISQTRASFGREQINIPIIASYKELESLPSDSFDVIFANHVLEHLPSISFVFSLFYRLLKPEGHLLIFVPDCSGCEISSTFDTKKSWAFGEAHAIAFDVSFFRRNLSQEGLTVLQCRPEFNEIELMLIAQKQG